MATYEIPLSPAPQVFDIVLAGVAYTLTLQWRDAPQAGWVLDIALQSQEQAGTPLVRGIPLVTGADLLAQYGYLSFGGSLIVQTDHNPDAVPTFDNLGTEAHLYFITTDAAA